MITRDFGNGNKVVDWTEELVIVPNQWGILNQSGLFQEEGVTTGTVQFEVTTKNGALIVDKAWGERSVWTSDQTGVIKSWTVPHFPHDAYISPADIAGKRAYGTADQQETLANVRVRKMERIAQNHAWTLEYARWQLLTTGTVYAPSGTVSNNYFTEFGVTQTVVDFALQTSTTDVVSKVETVIAQIQDNASGENITGITFYCSPAFFSKLISHASVKTAYQYYTSTQEPLRNRLGGNLTTTRTFVFAGATFIEVRGNYNGSLFIPSGDAVAIPEGTSIFRTYFAPSMKFDLLGSTGERMYMFEYMSPRGDKYELETESNHLSAIVRPAMVVRCFTA